MEHGATGTAIVLFTDVVDSTGFRTRLGDDTADSILEAHERVVCSAIEAHHGSVVKYLGDGVMATFVSASDAIAAAVDLNRDIQDSDEAQGVQLRTGLSAGDVAFRHGDCHGIPVVEAARLCDAAGENTILASEVVCVLAGSRSSQAFDPRGRLVLKGLAEPLATVEVLWRPSDDEVLTVPFGPGERDGLPAEAASGTGGWPERYRLVQQVGAGGEGQVWRAHDSRHDRDVALKIRREGGAQEVRALLELRPHPNLPLARDDFTLDDGRTVIVMDWIRGDDLGAVLAATGDPGLPVPLVLDCVTSVAEALDHLHGHQPPLVHSDIKPANVVRTARGDFVVVDFGWSSHPGDSPWAGTKGYVAPETACGEAAGPPADVYSLAATSVALLTGRPPDGSRPEWRGLTDREVWGVQAVVEEGLATDPARRPATAGEFAIRLREAFESALPDGDVTLVSVECGAAKGAWERCPDDTAAALAQFTRAAETVAVAEGGRKLPVHGYGTAALFVFESMGHAAAASEGLHGLASELDRPGVGLAIKAGMHVGSVSMIDGCAAGPAVAKVGRLSAAASPGETAMSPTASAAATAESVALPSSGHFRVRGDRDLAIKEEDPHVRLRRRRIMLAALAVLVVAVGVTAIWAVDRSQRLGDGTSARRASGLAADAVRLRSDRPEVASLAAVEAAHLQEGIGDEELRATTGEDVRSALLATVVTPSRLDLAAHAGHRIVAVAVSQPQLPFGSTRGRHEMLASLDDTGMLRTWDLTFGSPDPVPSREVQLEAPAPDAGADSVTISPDGRLVAARTGRGVEVAVLDQGQPPRSAAVLDGAVAPPAFGPAGANIAVDRAGHMWDLACANSPSGCGLLVPAWVSDAEGIQFATPRWNVPQGVAAVVSVDTLAGPTITRREYEMTRGESGWAATAVLKESAFTDERCAQVRCRLLGIGDEILLDVVNGPRNHVLSLVEYGDSGFVRLPSEAQVPYQPHGIFPNPRGTVARPNEDTPSDTFVLMGDTEGNLYTQAADLQQGLSTVDTRVAYRAGGSVALVDATATFVVGGDTDGILHLSEIAPGQSFVNAGLPEADPAMPVEGTGLVLHPDGPTGADCCELRAADPSSGEELRIGRARPGQVGGRSAVPAASWQCPARTPSRSTRSLNLRWPRYRRRRRAAPPGPCRSSATVTRTVCCSPWPAEASSGSPSGPTALTSLRPSPSTAVARARRETPF